MAGAAGESKRLTPHRPHPLVRRQAERGSACTFATRLGSTVDIASDAVARADLRHTRRLRGETDAERAHAYLDQDPELEIHHEIRTGRLARHPGFAVVPGARMHEQSLDADRRRSKRTENLAAAGVEHRLRIGCEGSHTGQSQTSLPELQSVVPDPLAQLQGCPETHTGGAPPVAGMAPPVPGDPPCPGTLRAVPSPLSPHATARSPIATVPAASQTDRMSRTSSVRLYTSRRGRENHFPLSFIFSIISSTSFSPSLAGSSASESPDRSFSTICSHSSSRASLWSSRSRNTSRSSRGT